jgi:hypothetical protein
MKYDDRTPIGLTWAAIIDVPTSYDWDPAAAAPGVPAAALLGVEAPLWSETLANIRDVEFLALPRLRRSPRWPGRGRRIGSGTTSASGSPRRARGGPRSA